METHWPTVVPTPDHVAALDQLGDEIAKLSAYLEAGHRDDLESGD
jgi:hypothetical protein